MSGLADITAGGMGRLHGSGRLACVACFSNFGLIPQSGPNGCHLDLAASVGSTVQGVSVDDGPGPDFH